MAGSETPHNPCLTDRGGIYGFYCPCGIGRVGWTVKAEAEFAAAAHHAEPRPYGTCAACGQMAGLTIYGWCYPCHPVEKAKTLHCRGCAQLTPVTELWRTGHCFDCQERLDSLRHEALLGGL